MTTAGTNGAPEDAAKDDPFAYLYRPAEGEQAASQPRDSYSRPFEVGRAQYGQQPALPPQPPGPARPVTTQMPLPQQPRYAEHSRPQPGEQPPAGRSKAVVIGAVAVVAAIAIGAGVALSKGDANKSPDKAAGSTSASAKPSGSASAVPSPSATSSVLTNGTAVADAAAMTLDGGLVTAKTVTGAKAKDGAYVSGFKPGATLSWKIDATQAAVYRVHVRFNNSTADAQAVVKVDGKPTYTPVKLRNYKPGLAPEQSWYSSWINAEISQGAHTITLECATGPCDFLVDQIAVTPDGADPGW